MWERRKWTSSTSVICILYGEQVHNGVEVVEHDEQFMWTSWWLFDWLSVCVCLCVCERVFPFVPSQTWPLFIKVQAWSASPCVLLHSHLLHFLCSISSHTPWINQQKQSLWEIINKQSQIILFCIIFISMKYCRPEKHNWFKKDFMNPVHRVTGIYNT